MTHKILGINIDHVATLRQARGTEYPSVTKAAIEAISGGADQITVHLREDRRHIQDRDVWELKKILSVPFNLEMAINDEIVDIATELKPDLATIVPEKRAELTTEGGLDCVLNEKKLSGVVRRLEDAGIKTSLFIAPDDAQIRMASELGASSVELHTGFFCDAKDEVLKKNEFLRLKNSAALAHELRFRVAAGHGLNYENVSSLSRNVLEISEYNIGHSVIARALSVGIKNAVSEMKRLIEGGIL